MNDLLHPLWPHGFDAWNRLGVVFLVALFQIVKASLMWWRTKIHCRLGSSLIAANYALGAGYALSAWNTLYPHLRNPWEQRIILNIVILLVAWGLVEMLLTTKLVILARQRFKDEDAQPLK